MVGTGRIAQLGEHSPYKAGVTGSIPVPPTINTFRVRAPGLSILLEAPIPRTAIKWGGSSVG